MGRSDPLAAVRVASVDASQRGEHPAGEQPPSDEAEHEQERQHDGRGRTEAVSEGRTGCEATTRDAWW